MSLADTGLRCVIAAVLRLAVTKGACEQSTRKNDRLPQIAPVGKFGQ